MKAHKSIIILFFILSVIPEVRVQAQTFGISKSAKLVEENTYGKTKWYNLVDRGGMFYVNEPAYINGFKDQVTFIKLPDLEKITVGVPLDTFFTNNKELLVDNVLYSTLASGKERKNYWIEDCFFYDTENGEAGLRILNYYLLKKGNIKRTYYVHWDLKENKITNAILLLEEDNQQKPKVGDEYTAMFLYPVGYNHEKKLYYYIKTETQTRIDLVGKYKQYTALKLRKYIFYAVSSTDRKVAATIETGSSGRLHYNQDLNICFLPAYKDLAHVTEKKYPEGFIINLNTGTYIKTVLQMWTYWVDFNSQKNVLYHVSSSTGKLWAVNITTGEKIGELYVGDAGDDEYRKLGLLDNNTLLYYLQAKVVFIDINEFKVIKTVDLTKLSAEISYSSPGYILPDGKGILVEARTNSNKTTGFLYYLENN